LLAITIAITVYAVISITDVEDEYAYVLAHPNVRYKILRNVELNLSDLQRLTNRVALYAGYVSELNALERQLGEVYEQLRAGIFAYQESLLSDGRMDQETIDSRMAGSDRIMAQISRYMGEIVYMAMYRARQGDMPWARDFVRRGGINVITIIDYEFGLLFSETQELMAGINEELAAATQSTVRLLYILAIIGIVLGIIIAIFISFLITRPIRRVVHILDEVSAGNLDIDSRSNLSKDETGRMMRNLHNLIEIIKNILGDITEFSREATVNGDIEFRIDASRYQGGFAEVIDGLNNFSDSFVADVLAVLDVLRKVNAGDFNVELAKMPGKKVILNETVDSLIANLNSVVAEVGEMIEAAAVKGDMNFVIDETRFEGGWREIMLGLNRVAAAVDEPIVEINAIMNKLAVGDFSSKVSGDYRGHFLSMREAVNETIGELSAYISEMSGVLAKISGGDLTAKINREYIGNFAEIKRSINDISISLNRTMADISYATDQVLFAADLISKSATDLAAGAKTQSASVEELGTTVDTINEQTRLNVDNAANADRLSGRATENARAGNESMTEMLTAMTNMEESSKGISKVINAIQEIAFQTNLLALNASVEAARAGEHGRGFSVVADQVRSLAEASQNAATETTDMISSTIDSVAHGSEIAENTAKSLSTIVSDANRVLDIVRKITISSNEQAQAIDQIGKDLASISRVVQTNSAVSEQTAAASEQLNTQADMLRGLVGYFRLK
ncbi:MAG: methyl-accepting chemotaxis protein, partial [Defluviitaleaceae bacterium]|nr:methyl-accepting chemotaxis protein [Defluviitaleaceae bacterium]